MNDKIKIKEHREDLKEKILDQCNNWFVERFQKAKNSLTVKAKMPSAMSLSENMKLAPIFAKLRNDSTLSAIHWKIDRPTDHRIVKSPKIICTINAFNTSFHFIWIYKNYSRYFLILYFSICFDRYFNILNDK